MISQRSIKLVLALLVVGIFLLIGRNYLGQLHLISQAHWMCVAGVALIHLLTLWLQGLTLKWGLDAFGQPISERESFSLFAVASYANLLLPRSGVGTTALYLNRVRKCSMVDYSSVVLFNGALFVFACTSVAAIEFAIDAVVNHELPMWWVTGGLLVMLVISGLAVTVKWQLSVRYHGPGKSVVHRLNHATSRLAGSSSVWRMGLAHFVLVFLRALRLYVSFRALGIDAPFYGVLFASVLGDLALVVSITPAALGFREAAIAIAAAKTGIAVPVAISVAIFDRLVFSLTVVIVAQLLFAFAFKRDAIGAAKSSPAN